MRTGLVVITLCGFSLQLWGQKNTPESAFEDCQQCHPQQMQSYQRSKMAIAAKTATFLSEWKQKGQPDHCYRCHSPGRGDGVTCVDCHQGARHPYQQESILSMCSQCHDAPGEITSRSYRQSPSALKGEDCSDCHMDKALFGHEFIGPTTPGFLEGIAKLSVAFRQDKDNTMALISIRHIAGHALPGGTTGRSVWLVTNEMDSNGHITNTTSTRFGWINHETAKWRENTLPAGRNTVVEVPLSNMNRTRLLRIKLIYRFLPGILDAIDSEQVILDELEFSLSLLNRSSFGLKFIQ